MGRLPAAFFFAVVLWLKHIRLAELGAAHLGEKQKWESTRDFVS